MAEEENYALSDEVRYELELVDNPIFNAIGEVTIEIENGLVKFKNRMNIYQTDLNADGSLNGSSLEKRALKSITFDLHNEVADCVHKLAQTGYIPLDYNCHVNEDKNPEYEAILSVKNWSGGPLMKDYFDIYPPLFDKTENSFSDALNGPLMKAIIHFEGAYSEEWYCALICRIYFSSSLDTDINNIAMMGKLIEQMHWKHNHEKHALRGEKLEMKQVANNEKRKARPQLRKEYLIAKSVSFIKSNDADFILADDSTKIRILIAEGKKERPELFLNGKKHISPSQIKKDYQDIKSEISLKLREK